MAFQPPDPERQGGGVDPVDGGDGSRFRQQAVQPRAAVEAVGAAVVDPADLSQASLKDVAEGGEGLGVERLGSDGSHQRFPIAKRRSSVPTMRTIGSSRSR